jgi:hypothetical protein
MDKTMQITFIVFTAVTSISVLVQAIAILGVFLTARKTQKKLNALAEDVRLHVLPAVSISRGVIEDLSPKLKVIASNLVDSSTDVRAMAQDVSGVVGDVASRTRAQAAHVDGMVQGTLDQITQANQAFQHGIAVPFRQLNGIVSGLRAGWDVLSQRRSTSRSEKESDLFV